MQEFPRKIACGLVFLFLLFPVLARAAPPDVVQISPSAGQVFNSSNNVTFTCNVTDDGQVLNITLFHDLNGTFSANQTERYGEAYFDSNTSFLCNFNSNLSCQASGNGNPAENQSLSFESGVFSSAVKINEVGILAYQTPGNFDRSQGTIDFWIKPGNEFGSVEQYAFHVGDSESGGVNEMSIYMTAGLPQIYFEIRDESGSNYYARSDISSWQIGTWYHVAAVWDLDGNMGYGDPILLYTNGSDGDSGYDCGSPPCSANISYTSITSTMRIGSDKNGMNQMNATMDDFRISSSVRSASEISATYYEGLANRSSVSESWSFYSVPDGSYSWSCVAYDDDLESNSTLDSLFVDMYSQPTVQNIYLSPNSSDDIDPGVTINVTANITDPSGVSTVIFQYKEAEEENWNNITMAYNASSGLYVNASFQTISNDMGVYYYRIWSNDSKGSSGYSSTQSVTSAVDFTWTRSPASFGTVLVLLGSVGNVGILTINNTGDRTLNFTISDNWPLFYNGSDSTNFYVTNHTTITINVTAQFSSESSENDIVMTINASHYSNPPSLSPISLTTNATINSYSGGPHLSLSITEYSGMVSQSQTFNLSVRVKNIGNETASDVWLNWTLPEGWEASAGNITNFIGNLSPGSLASSNVTITVSPSAADPGTFIIYVNSSCFENVSGSDSKIIGVACSSSDGVCGHGCSYVTDSDCGIPSGPGGGTSTDVLVGGGGAAEIRYVISMDFQSRMDIERNHSNRLAVTVSNPVRSANLSSIYIQVSGYPLIHTKISPSSINTLGYNSSAYFEIEFFAPSYMRYGIYNITLTARATGSTITSRNTTAVETSKPLVLVIRSIKENETVEMVESGRNAIEEMTGLGLSTAVARGLLEKALAQISEWDYDNALETLKSLMETRNRSVSISSTIRQMEDDIVTAESYGIPTPESRKMSSLSKSALEREDYVKAEERINNAMVAYVIESRGIETMKFLHAYWWLVLGASASLASGSYALHRRRLRTTRTRRLKKLSEEEVVVKGIMEKARSQYYKEKIIPAAEFHGMMAQNESRLAEIRKKKSRLLEISGSREGREGYLRKEIANVQKKYFEERTITKSSYSRTVQGLREELADALRNIENVEARRKGQSRLLIIFLFCVLMMPAILAQADERQAALDAMTNAEGWISEMRQMGFPANRANDTLNEARLLFSRGFYKGAESLANDVQSIKANAARLEGISDQTEEKIYELESQGIDASQAKALFAQGLDALVREDYDGSESLFNQAQSKSEELQAEASLRRVSRSGSLEWMLAQATNNWHIILMACLVAAAAGLGFRRSRRRRKKKHMLAGLEREKASLEKAAADAQKKYFEKGAMSKADYEIFSSSYRKKLTDIRRRMAVLEGVLSKGEPGEKK